MAPMLMQTFTFIIKFLYFLIVKTQQLSLKLEPHKMKRVKIFMHPALPLEKMEIILVSKLLLWRKTTLRLVDFRILLVMLSIGMLIQLKGFYSFLIQPWELTFIEILALMILMIRK